MALDTSPPVVLPFRSRASGFSGSRRTTCSNPEGRSRLVFGEDERFAKWAAEQMHGNLWDGKYVAFGLERARQIIAAVGFTDFIPRASVCGHLVSSGKHWLNRPLLRAMFLYPFMQLQVKRLTGMVPTNNGPMCRFLAHLGFTEEAILKDVLVDGDVTVYRMYAHECRYLRI